MLLLSLETDSNLFQMFTTPRMHPRCIFKAAYWDKAKNQRTTSFSSFYRCATGAMLVYDVTNSTSFENLESWLDELQLHEENIVIMLLGNKCDRNEDREVPAKNAEMFAGD